MHPACLPLHVPETGAPDWWSGDWLGETSRGSATIVLKATSLPPQGSPSRSSVMPAPRWVRLPSHREHFLQHPLPQNVSVHAPHIADRGDKRTPGKTLIPSNPAGLEVMTRNLLSTAKTHDLEMAAAPGHPWNHHNGTRTRKNTDNCWCSVVGHDWRPHALPREKANLWFVIPLVLRYLLSPTWLQVLMHACRASWCIPAPQQYPPLQ